MNRAAAWRDRALVFLDLETTGLEPARAVTPDRIIEIGALRTRPGRPDATFQRLVRLAPPGDLPVPIVKLTGITPEMLAREGAAPGDALERLAAFLGDCPVIGHNISFDLDFLAAAGWRPANPSLDTALFAALVLPEENSYRLGELCRDLCPGVEGHRALADAAQCRALFLHLRDFARAYLPAGLLREVAGLLRRPEPLLASLVSELARSARGERGKRFSTAGPAAGTGGRPGPAGARPGLDRMFADLPPELAPGRARLVPALETARAVERAVEQAADLALAVNREDLPLAYLLPALRRAGGRGNRLLVAFGRGPNTAFKLYRVRQKCLDRLPGCWGRTALLFHPSAYLCRRRWARLFRAQKSRARRRKAGSGADVLLACLLAFVRRTREGLLFRTASFLKHRYPDMVPWLERVACRAECAAAPACRRRCFLRRALRDARRADIVFADFSVLRELPGLLPGYRHLVLDLDQERGRGYRPANAGARIRFRAGPAATEPGSVS